MKQRFEAIVIGGSAGSFPVVTSILHELGDKFSLPVLLALHRLKHVRHGFAEALNIRSSIKVVEPLDKDEVRGGKVYLAPANYHMMIDQDKRFAISTTDLVKFSRPSIDILLESAAIVYGEKLLGILLSGANTDGAYGMRAIKDYGGFTIVQDPVEATITTMPNSAIESTDIDRVLNVKQISEFIKKI